MKLLVACRDREYAQALGMALISMSRVLRVETGEPSEQQFREFSGDLILTDPEYSGWVQGTCLALAENETGKPDEIFRYAGADRIGTKAALLCGRGTLLFGTGGGAARVVGFIGASGGSGKTSLALAAATEMTESLGEQVFYLSFEPFSASEAWFGEKCDCRQIGEFLYYLFSGDEERCRRELVSFLVKNGNGSETFCPSGGFNELSSLKPEEGARLLEMLCGIRRYDHILLDLDCGNPELWKKLCGMCGTLVLVESGDFQGRIKGEKLRNCLEKEGITGSVLEVRGRWCEEQEQKSDGGREKRKTGVDGVENGRMETGTVGVVTGRLETGAGKFGQTALTIEEDPESFYESEKGMGIMLHRRFGAGVRILVEEIEKHV